MENHIRKDPMRLLLFLNPAGFLPCNIIPVPVPASRLPTGSRNSKVVTFGSSLIREAGFNEYHVAAGAAGPQMVTTPNNTLVSIFVVEGPPGEYLH